MDKRATLKDVAQATGVSVTTVYKALHNKPKISDGLRAEIVQAAESLHYSPNRIAQALARNPICIGIIIPTCPATFFDYVAAGAQKVINELRDYNVLGEIRRVSSNDEAQTVWREFYRRRVNGVVSCFNDDNRGCESIQRSFPDVDIPIVIIATLPKDGTKTVGYVCAPGEIMGALGGEILLTGVERGRPVAVCVPDLIMPAHVSYVNAFVAECARQGVKCAGRFIMGFEPESGAAAVDEILRCAPDVGGIYVGSNNAPMLCQQLEKRGLGGRVRVVGHDLYPELVDCLLGGSLYATIFQNQFGNISRATKALVDYMLNKETSFDSVWYRPEIVMRSNLGAYKGLY